MTCQIILCLELWGQNRYFGLECGLLKVEGGAAGEEQSAWKWKLRVGAKMELPLFCFVVMVCGGGWEDGDENESMRAGSKMQAGTPIVFQTFVFTLLLLPLTKGTKGCPSSQSFSPAADFGWNIFSLWLTCIGAPPTPKIEGMVKPVQCCFFWVTSLAFGIFPIFGIF